MLYIDCVYFTMYIIFSVGNSITFEHYPQRVSLSIYPINTMIRAIVLLLQRNEWSNIASLIDSNTIMWEPFHRGLIDGFAKTFDASDFSSKVRYNVFQCNASANNAEIVETFLAIAETSRGKKPREIWCSP